MKEYVHRAGRLAQAGQAGHALLVLLPSERQYVEVLELCSLRDISLLLLSLMLLSAVGQNKIRHDKPTMDKRVGRTKCPR